MLYLKPEICMEIQTGKGHDGRSLEEMQEQELEKKLDLKADQEEIIDIRGKDGVSFKEKIIHFLKSA